MTTITDMTVEELTERAAGIAQGAISVGGLNEESRDRADNDIRAFIGDIYVRYDDARQESEKHNFPSEEWFDEKLSAFRSFLLMGIGTEKRNGLPERQVSENIDHYRALINNCLRAI